MVEFGGVGVTYKEIVYSKGEGGGVGVVAEKHRGGGFRVTVLCEKGYKAKLGTRAPIGEDQAQFLRRHRR